MRKDRGVSPEPSLRPWSSHWASVTTTLAIVSRRDRPSAAPFGVGARRVLFIGAADAGARDHLPHEEPLRAATAVSRDFRASKRKLSARRFRFYVFLTRPAGRLLVCLLRFVDGDKFRAAKSR